MPIDSYQISTALGSQLAMLGNQQAFATGAHQVYTSAVPTPSPLQQAASGVLGLLNQPFPPGSIHSQLMLQGATAQMLGAAISPQTPLLGRITTDYLSQYALNQNLARNFTFARPGGFGFTMPQMQAIGSFVQAQAMQNPMWTRQEMFALAGAGINMGMFQGVRDVQQFQQQFRQLLTAVHQVTRILGGTLQEGLQFIGQMRQMGVLNIADAQRLAGIVPGLAAAGGMPVNQLIQFGGGVAQMLRPLGVRGPTGMEAGMRALGTVATAVRTGVISEQLIWQATGQTGQAAQQALAGRLMEVGARFTLRGAGKISMAAFYDPATGRFRAEDYERFLRGELTPSDIVRLSRENIAKIGGIAEWQARIGEFRGEFLRGTGGMGELVLMRQAFAKYWEKPYAAEHILRRQFGMSQEEARAAVAMINRLPRLQEEMRISQEIAEEERIRQQRWEQRTPQYVIRQKLKNLEEATIGRAEKWIVNRLDDLAKAFEEGMRNVVGGPTTTMSAGGRMRIFEMMETAKGYSELQSLYQKGSQLDQILKSMGGGRAPQTVPTASSTLWGWARGGAQWIGNLVGKMSQMSQYGFTLSRDTAMRYGLGTYARTLEEAKAIAGNLPIYEGPGGFIVGGPGQNELLDAMTTGKIAFGKGIFSNISQQDFVSLKNDLELQDDIKKGISLERLKDKVLARLNSKGRSVTEDIALAVTANLFDTRIFEKVGEYKTVTLKELADRYKINQGSLQSFLEDPRTLQNLFRMMEGKAPEQEWMKSLSIEQRDIIRSAKSSYKDIAELASSSFNLMKNSIEEYSKRWTEAGEALDKMTLSGEFAKARAEIQKKVKEGKDLGEATSEVMDAFVSTHSARDVKTFERILRESGAEPLAETLSEKAMENRRAAQKASYYKREATLALQAKFKEGKGDWKKKAKARVEELKAGIQALEPPKGAIFEALGIVGSEKSDWEAFQKAQKQEALKKELEDLQTQIGAAEGKKWAFKKMAAEEEKKQQAVEAARVDGSQQKPFYVKLDQTTVTELANAIKGEKDKEDTKPEGTQPKGG